jgi:hypothetical protein
MISRCVHHAERPTHAICMACRKSLCQECASTWEGINYCAACLGQRRSERRTGVAWGGWIGLALAIGGLAWLHARLLVWVGVLLAGWR